MSTRTKAEELVSDPEGEMANELIASVGEAAASELLFELRTICYETWNSEPVSARNAAAAAELLAERFPSDLNRAASLWIRGISELTEGRLDESVSALERSAELYRGEGNESEAARVAVAMLVPLGLLGSYEKALELGAAALAALDAAGDDLAAGKVEMNLSNIASRKGLLSVARNYGLAAIERFSKTGDGEWKTLAQNDLAHTYADLNEFRSAGEYFAAALESARDSGLSVTEAEIEASMGNLAMLRGRYDEALRLLESSRRGFESLGMPHQSAIAELEIADIYRTLNLVEESVEIYRSVVGKLAGHKLRGEEARARLSLGHQLERLGDLPGALKQFESSGHLFEEEGNRAGTARALAAASRAELRRGRVSNASDLAESAVRSSESTEDRRLVIELGQLAGEILLAKSDPAAARGELESARSLSARSGLPEYLLECTNALGTLEMSENRIEDAERRFREAAEIVERMRSPLAADEFRVSYLAARIAPFVNLTKLYIDQGAAGKAFEMSESARARSLLDSVQASPDRSPGKDPSDAFEVRLEEAREELNFYYSRLNAAVDAEEQETLMRQVRERESEIADLSRRIESTLQRAEITHVDGEPEEAVAHAVRNKLGTDRALIAYIEIDSLFYAFALTDQGVFSVGAIAEAGEVGDKLDALRFQFGSFRYGSTGLGLFKEKLKEKADRHLADLYDLILAPVSEIIGNRDLVVIPAGILNYVPFAALRSKDGYLIEDRSIVHSPSARLWTRERSYSKRSGSGPLLIGVPDDAIPLVRDEIDAISGILAKPDSLFGADATVAAFAEHAPEASLIHLACHGTFRNDNPLFSSLHLADGRLTARDIGNLDLNASLVTLSACESGLSLVHTGEEILGLARGFIRAGAGNILMSLWNVNDEAAAGMMKSFYGFITEGLSVESALARVQREMISDGMHPYFWAPFVTISRN